MRAWAALRPSSVESRFEALHASGLTELVGREEELELLLRRWSKAKTGEGQVVLLSGEAGIGKSRLTAALLERLATEPHTRLRYFCSPQHTDSAFYPIISQMERAAGLAHDDTAQAKLDKLDAVLAQTSTSKHDAALFAEMLSLLNDGRYPTLELAAQQRRQKTLEALTAQVEALSRSNSGADDFRGRTLDRPDKPRSTWSDGGPAENPSGVADCYVPPEFEPPWIGRPHVTALILNRLGEREIAAMIDRVTGNKSLPVSIKHDIIERTDGIPLFVEEMTKAVLEAESEGAARQTAAAVPSRAVAVPASLHASLMARLDRLGPAKEVAQIGAVIGREFSHPVLAAVVRKREAELNRRLTVSLKPVCCSGRVCRRTRHISSNTRLYRDAAYGTLLRGRRQELHRRIVSVLQQDFPDLVVSQPEVLAHHCCEGGMITEGIEYYLLASKRATAAMNSKEAAAHLNRGFTLLEQLPSSDPRKGQFRERIAASGWWFAYFTLPASPSLRTCSLFSQARVLICGHDTQCYS